MSTNIKFYIKESLKYFLRSKIFIRKELKEVERLYGLSEDELYAYKEEQFLKLFKHAITKSPFYKEFYGKAGITIDDIQSLKDIEKLPVLTKEIVRQNNKKIPTVATWRLFKARTSGTTGTPLTIYQSYKAIKYEQAHLSALYSSYGIKSHDKVISLRGYMNHDALRCKVHISNTLFLSSYHLNKSEIQYYFLEISKHQPKAIFGHPSSLYSLALLLKEQGLKLRIPIAITSSETLYGYQRTLIEDVLSIKIYDYYGCTEKTIALAQKNNSQFYFELPGYAVVEYFEDYLYTSSLINSTFPLIRYQVNDSIVTKEEQGKKLITSVIGRVEDVVIAKDETRIGRTDDLMTQAKHVSYAQIIQEQKGIVQVNIVPDIGFNQSEKEKIISLLSNKFGKNNMDIIINIVTKEEIIYTSRNKFKFVISKI